MSDYAGRKEEPRGSSHLGEMCVYVGSPVWVMV